MSFKKAYLADARTRILETAGEIFAEEGFRSATIRKICSRAGVNVALVSYHFGDKEGLYLAVLKHLRAKSLEMHPSNIGVDESPSPEEKLRAFVRSLLFRILGRDEFSWFGKLFVREIMEPTKAFDVMVEEAILPSYNQLISIVGEIIGDDADEFTMRYCTASIVSQCLFYRSSRAIISRIVGKDHFSSEEIEQIALHITRFSLEAMRACYETKKTTRSRKREG